jgi:transcription initiation factor TFIID TATA-box-binding protein
MIANRILKKLNEIENNFKIIDIHVVNFVFTGQISIKTTIEKIMADLNDKNACYEPEQFPGLIYKNWGATFILFSNGKLILTGIKDDNYANEVLIKFQKLIR